MYEKIVMKLVLQTGLIWSAITKNDISMILLLVGIALNDFNGFVFLQMIKLLSSP